MDPPPLRECEPDCVGVGQCDGADDGCGGTCDEACPVCVSVPFDVSDYLESVSYRAADNVI